MRDKRRWGSGSSGARLRSARVTEAIPTHKSALQEVFLGHMVTEEPVWQLAARAQQGERIKRIPRFQRDPRSLSSIENPLNRSV